MFRSVRTSWNDPFAHLLVFRSSAYVWQRTWVDISLIQVGGNWEKTAENELFSDLRFWEVFLCWIQYMSLILTSNIHQIHRSHTLNKLLLERKQISFVSTACHDKKLDEMFNFYISKFDEMFNCYISKAYFQYQRYICPSRHLRSKSCSFITFSTFSLESIIRRYR